MPRSSSPSPTITPMKPHPQTPDPTLTFTPDEEEELLQSIHLPHSLLMDDDDDPDPSPHFHAPLSSLLFPTSDASDDDTAAPADLKPPLPSSPPPRIDPSPHMSSQFYTFNSDSHALMVRCILEGRPATPDEIRAATLPSVLASWRAVWKDRNEDTAYLTAWKRIQDKLHAHLDSTSSRGFLYFKTNPSQCVSHFDQWQDIVAEAHADPDLLRHLGLKETLDRIRQAWTVGAKFYGIPESFIRVCISSCQVCSSATGSSSSQSVGAAAAGRSKRRRFEYTESFEVPAREVPQRLQQLAYKHKVVLCIRQKYIRYKPFMAEVKDYACHRAGEPSSAKKAKVLKREPYQSKRCGCSFRIRAIVPIANYNEKDKTFVYEEEGNAVFKLYAVHSGHEPGPLDGNARIIHRVVGQKGVLEVDPEVYGVREETENEPPAIEQNTDGHRTLLQQVQQIKAAAVLLEGKVAKVPMELVASLSHELSDVLQRLESVRTEHVEEPLIAGDDRVPRWGDEPNNYLDMHDRMFNKDAEILEEEETDFDSTLGTMIPWDSMPTECHDRKTLMAGGCKPDKWMMKEDCGDFDAKGVLKCGDDYEEAKLIKPLGHDGAMGGESSLVGMQVEGFYPENTKWYDSPGGLDHSGDSGDDRFRHGGLV